MRLKAVFAAVLASAAVAIGGSAPAAAQTAAQGPVERLAKAREIFERVCGVCHGLERPLSKTFDKAGWEKTIERMHDNGAEADAAERALVVAFLLTKNTFEAKCSLCHGVDRPLGASKSAADWLATALRMSAKQPGHVSEEEIADIAAYLAIVRPERK